MQMNATLLDPTSVQRCLPGVTWAPRLPVSITVVSDSEVELRLHPSLGLEQWLLTLQRCWRFPLKTLLLGMNAPAEFSGMMICPAFRKDLIEIIIQTGAEHFGLRIRRAALQQCLEEVECGKSS